MEGEQEFVLLRAKDVKALLIVPKEASEALIEDPELNLEHIFTGTREECKFEAIRTAIASSIAYKEALQFADSVIDQSLTATD